MQYRTFGRLDWRPSALGFGAMRLPTIGGDPAQIDEPAATQMIHYAIEQGVNYVDTAYPYHRGTSESFLGRVLKHGYRERVRLATKMPCWLIKEREDFDRYLDEQLARLQTDKVDFYLLHGLNSTRWSAMRDLGVLDWAEKAIATGCIGHLGFSFHDTYETFQEIVDAYDGWALCQIQYNYLDEAYQAGTRGAKYAADKGLGAVVMEPLRGGLLAGNTGQRQGQGLPPTIQALWDSADVRRSPAEWAFQWLWHQPSISFVLSGMSTLAQVEENIVSADRSRPGLLTDEELALIGKVRDQYRALSPIPCTDCKYCQPCPNNVAIPRIFDLHNQAMMFNAPGHARNAYMQWVPEAERGDRCLECGECEPKCPQGIAIIEWLEKADRYLTAG
ncbi:MAG: aldo/keto reductase [Chloroflexi bacterium]|nr:aldo/keto reductase [Chloroflexota bacterium]